MPRPTVYITQEQQEWLDNQESSRSGTIRQAVEFYRQRGLVWYRCGDCPESFKASLDAEVCPYCGGEAHRAEAEDG